MLRRFPQPTTLPPRMKNPSIFQRTLPHLLAIAAFLIIVFVYFSPVLDGKALEQGDILQAKGAAHEANLHREKTGAYPLWTNSMFGGMPTYLIAADYPNSWTTKAGRFFANLLPEPANYVFLYLVGFYILLVAIGVDAWVAVMGAIGYAFCSYNFINIEAGHASKVIAMGYLPPILGGVILAYRGRYWLGGALAGLFVGLQLFGNHVQITFYMFLAIGIYAAIEFGAAIRHKRLKPFFLASAVLLLGVVLAVGSHASRLLTTQEYSKESIRGKSELTPRQATGNDKQANTNGLNYEYAFQYSYGLAETFTLLIPNFNGGGSMARGLGKNSETYRAVMAQGATDVQARQFAEQVSPALYWGDLPIAGGPAYAGAVVVFLFVLGMFIIKSRIRWWLLASVALMVMLAWGRNFFLNDLLFNYVPLFDKFRAVTMTLTVVQVFLALGASLAVHELVNAKFTWDTFKKPLLWSFGLTAGLALVFAVLGGVFFDFKNTLTDARLPDWAVGPLRDDRAALLRGDAFRSFLFIAAAAGLLLAYLFKKFNGTVLALLLALTVLADMFAVDKRYLNDANFTVSRREQQRAYIQPTPVNEQILQDTTQYRVFNYASGITSDAITSYFHHSVGGYHGAKMRRYQDVLDSLLSKGKIKVLNMLNTKYLIVPDQQTQQPVVQRNPEALGNAWFVAGYKIVPNADAELQALDTLEPRTTAVVDARFAAQLAGLAITPDSTASIRLTGYQPEKLTYATNARSPQLAVFSEIYYANRDYWQADIDGKPVPHLRANYILRGMVVPAGSHTVTFRFIGNTYRQGEQIALVCSVLLLAFVGGAAFMDTRKRRENP